MAKRRASAPWPRIPTPRTPRIPMPRASGKPVTQIVAARIAKAVNREVPAPKKTAHHSTGALPPGFKRSKR